MIVRDVWFRRPRRVARPPMPPPIRAMRSGGGDADSDCRDMVAESRKEAMSVQDSLLIDSALLVHNIVTGSLATHRRLFGRTSHPQQSSKYATMFLLAGTSAYQIS